ncbi:hypothetical protein JXB41_05885 [Candidatus Woesearchaeota archaeon]|nr:hypothetical protein [Candidatus Woesearchaeota archaeon]
MLVLENIKKSQLTGLKKHGFKPEKPTNKYETLRLKGTTTLILYSSGKLVVAGSEDAVNKTENLLMKLKIMIPKETKTPALKKNLKKPKITGLAIGSDESLKGDTFGGIVVCAFRADDKTRERLKELKVKDSKKLNNAEISRLAKQLTQEFPKDYHAENIFPERYNKLNSKKNVTQILDELHKKCYKKLSRNKRIVHIVDEYPGCKTGRIIVKKAESKYVEVAAASVIARFEALKQIRQLERQAGFFIPLGSTHVEDALMELQRKELQAERFVKMKFRNVKDVLG